MIKIRLMKLWIIAGMCLFAFPCVQAQFPALISYQGRLVEGTNLYNGTVRFTFRFYTNSAGGSVLCTSTNVASAVDGLYDTVIGQYVTQGSLDAALNHPSVWLEVVANGTTLSPRERLHSVPYARMTEGLQVTAGKGVVMNPLSGTNTMAANALHAVITGGNINTVGTNASYASVGGGSRNTIQPAASNASIGGGSQNTIQTNATHGVIGGGLFNTIETFAWYGTIAGGSFNTIKPNSDYASIGGGFQNTVQTFSTLASIQGGSQNVVYPFANFAVIGGGTENVILTNAAYATIPGGSQNAAANYAFAAGRQAKAMHSGSFVWGDSVPSNVVSTTENQVTFRSSGGFRIFSNLQMTSGVQVAANSGAWTSLSDVKSKEAFGVIDPGAILEKVVAMPITTWRYKGQRNDIRHMGPTAQDFYAAFGLGDLPDTGITSIDADGVALAAIQALSARITQLEDENTKLHNRLNALEKKQFR